MEQKWRFGNMKWHIVGQNPKHPLCDDRTVEGRWLGILQGDAILYQEIPENKVCEKCKKYRFEP